VERLDQARRQAARELHTFARLTRLRITTALLLSTVERVIEPELGRVLAKCARIMDEADLRLVAVENWLR
jgi:hypothetical protein